MLQHMYGDLLIKVGQSMEASLQLPCGLTIWCCHNYHRVHYQTFCIVTWERVSMSSMIHSSGQGLSFSKIEQDANHWRVATHPDEPPNPHTSSNPSWRSLFQVWR